MVTLAARSASQAPSPMYVRWYEALVGTYAWLRDWMPTIGNFSIPTGTHGQGLWLHAGRRFGRAIAAQRLAESYYQKGERISAVGVLTDAAAQFSEGRFPPPSVDLLQKIVDDEFSAASLRAVAHTCLEHGESKHLIAAVCLLGMAYEHDRTDTHALELLVCAFEKMGLEGKAQKVRALLVELSEEEPTVPGVVVRRLT